MTAPARLSDILITAITPVIWGLSYYVTTEWLPHGYPVWVSFLRALPAGLLLMVIVRQWPSSRLWWTRVAILGFLNFTFFWIMLFISAYRLPGGVAATLGAIQPLIVILLARLTMGAPVRPLAVVAGAAGLVGVALLVLTPRATLDAFGIACGLAGAVSMAAGTVLTRKWQPSVPSLTFTAWQLTAGGLQLLPLALLMEPMLPWPTPLHLAGYLWLGLPSGALAYWLWFRGIARLEPGAVATLAFLSPVTATLVGWALLGQSLTLLQTIGMIVVLASVWLAQRAAIRG